jgi:hypothetical protein
MSGRRRHDPARSSRALSICRPLKPRRYEGTFAYKYRTVEHLERLREILLDDKLYFPTAHELNDPEEARPPLAASSQESLIAVLIELNMAAKPFLTNRGLTTDAGVIDFYVRHLGPDKWLEMLKRNLDPRLQRFRIYSLSKRWNNPHLWRAYGGNHTGYCLEFRNKDPFGPIFDVRYDDVALDITGPERSKPYFLFYKTKSWKDEEEVRMIRQQDSDSRLSFDAERLTRVILGRDIARTDAARIREWVRHRTLPLRVVSERDLPDDLPAP